jgi:hypothetical protein
VKSRCARVVCRQTPAPRHAARRAAVVGGRRTVLDASASMCRHAASALARDARDEARRRPPCVRVTRSNARTLCVPVLLVPLPDLEKQVCMMHSSALVIFGVKCRGAQRRRRADDGEPRHGRRARVRWRRGGTSTPKRREPPAARQPRRRGGQRAEVPVFVYKQRARTSISRTLTTFMQRAVLKRVKTKRS